MINAFIDTSIFISEGYVKGKSIATLFVLLVNLR